MSFLKQFKYWSLVILAIISFVELLLFFDIHVFWGVLYSIIGWSLVIFFTLQPRIVQNYPLSSLVVIGYGLCSFYLPIIATLLEGKPITYNLQVPDLVFFYGIISLLIVVITHRLYVYISDKNRKINTTPSILYRVLSMCKIYKTPTDGQLWIMGGVGLISIYYYYFIAGGYTTDSFTSGTRFIQAFIMFVYSPYFIIFKRLYSEDYYKDTKLPRKTIILLSGYSLLVLIGAMITNHRSTFMGVILTIGSIYLVGLLINKYSFKILSVKNILIIVIALILMNPLLDLGYAMVAARSVRASSTSSELIEETIKLWSDKESLNAVKRQWSNEGVIENVWWDEYYLDNIFLARLCNLKFADLSLFHNERIQDKSGMQNYYIESIICMLPSPVLEFLDIKIDKELITKASAGDFLYYYSTHDGTGLTGKRQGHLEGLGLSIFGNWYFIALFIISFILFALIDSLFNSKTKLFSVASFSYISMFLIFFNGEGLTFFTSFIIRGYIQLVLLYFVLFVFTRFITNNFFKSKRKVRRL